MDAPRPDCTPVWPLLPAIGLSRTEFWTWQGQEQGVAFLGMIFPPLREWQRWTEQSHIPPPTPHLALVLQQSGGEQPTWHWWHSSGRYFQGSGQEGSCSDRGDCISTEPSPREVPLSPGPAAAWGRAPWPHRPTAQSC